MSTKLVAFDALMLDGKDLRALPLVQRKGMLGASCPVARSASCTWIT